MTEQAATLYVVAAFIDPSNNFTWWAADDAAATRKQFREAFMHDLVGSLLFTEAGERADWPKVMRMLAAARRAYLHRLPDRQQTMHHRQRS